MIAISVQNVTKDYKIYSKRGQKMRELLTLNHRQYHDTKRALEDISFDVAKGECIGIIGDNGSGKSTILKMLAGTSYPSEGAVHVEGDVSYILDVATGFNYDFTGRENIHTKCALLGLTPAEIEERFNSILEFSGLEERIDHPIKTYSTGMIVRLGFSVAIHIPFDIFIVDEVLSVGDYLFQRKCIHAIRRIIESGKTVVITSHALSDVSTFCDRLILLQDGKIAMMGETEDIIRAYIQDCERRHASIEAPIVEDKAIAPCEDTALGTVTIHDVRILDDYGNLVESTKTGSSINVACRFSIHESIPNPCLRLQLYTNEGQLVLGTNNYRLEMDYGVMKGEYEIIFALNDINLLHGDYYINFGIWPDEYKSYTARTPFASVEYKNVLKVESNRKDGGGLTRANTSLTLNKLKG